MMGDESWHQSVREGGCGGEQRTPHTSECGITSYKYLVSNVLL